MKAKKRKARVYYCVVDIQYPDCGEWFAVRSKAVEHRNIKQMATGVDTRIFVIRRVTEQLPKQRGNK